eukprot:TRINITY_DN45080_c0_g1_i1.p1 TRINITY_DN45080_c0_g1~~TRINITY_DN45080_c0_g1_i1.p1  ORF type:complete len:1281 (-),score=353.14 TRINITY_DN45080_c0_g1_i1:96-3938(-)
MAAAAIPAATGGGGRALGLRESNQALAELKTKLEFALSRLNDQDTQRTGLDEIRGFLETLYPDWFPVVIGCIGEAGANLKPLGRCESVKLLGLLAELHGEAVVPLLPRLLQVVVTRLQDADLHLREACAETVFRLARSLVIDADSSQVFAGLLKPLFGALAEHSKWVQIGAAACICSVIQGSRPEVIRENLMRLVSRLVQHLQLPLAMARPQLLSACIYAMQAVSGVDFDEALPALMPCLESCLGVQSDWQTRKQAIEVLQAIGDNLELGTSLELATATNSSARPTPLQRKVALMLEVVKQDKVRAVREAVKDVMLRWSIAKATLANNPAYSTAARSSSPVAAAAATPAPEREGSAKAANERFVGHVTSALPRSSSPSAAAAQAADRSAQASAQPGSAGSRQSRSVRANQRERESVSAPGGGISVQVFAGAALGGGGAAPAYFDDTPVGAARASTASLPVLSPEQIEQAAAEKAAKKAAVTKALSNAELHATKKPKTRNRQSIFNGPANTQFFKSAYTPGGQQADEEGLIDIPFGSEEASPAGGADDADMLAEEEQLRGGEVLAGASPAASSTQRSSAAERGRGPGTGSGRRQPQQAKAPLGGPDEDFALGQQDSVRSYENGESDYGATSGREPEDERGRSSARGDAGEHLDFHESEVGGVWSSLPLGGEEEEDLALHHHDVQAARRLQSGPAPGASVSGTLGKYLPARRGDAGSDVGDRGPGAGVVQRRYSTETNPPEGLGSAREAGDWQWEDPSAARSSPSASRQQGSTTPSRASAAPPLGDRDASVENVLAQLAALSERLELQEEDRLRSEDRFNTVMTRLQSFEKICEQQRSQIRQQAGQLDMQERQLRSQDDLLRRLEQQARHQQEQLQQQELQLGQQDQQFEQQEQQLKEHDQQLDQQDHMLEQHRVLINEASEQAAAAHAAADEASAAADRAASQAKEAHGAAEKASAAAEAAELQASQAAASASASASQAAIASEKERAPLRRPLGQPEESERSELAAPSASAATASVLQRGGAAAVAEALRSGGPERDAHPVPHARVLNGGSSASSSATGLAGAAIPEWAEERRGSLGAAAGGGSAGCPSRLSSVSSAAGGRPNLDNVDVRIAVPPLLSAGSAAEARLSTASTAASSSSLAGPPRRSGSALWEKVLENCENGKYLDAYKQVIAEPEETCLLRLMAHTGPIVERLDAESNSRLIRRLIHILSSPSKEPAIKSISQIFGWLWQALDVGIHFTSSQVEDLAAALQKVSSTQSALPAAERTEAARLLTGVSALRR